ncbi:hypothetical protein [Streptomyces sp. MI02-7b]|uniref:hypothetical protein n=1 Tax=Streptomyces sp. MI02-7b TaxID=462941 RepID=UPI0029B4E7ED|nr:hypothetical protein [Streptomyces sp. MI02-7b]MDX3072729.1 hypothetical protein [Streptomyces sp. MI02-7b]
MAAVLGVVVVLFLGACGTRVAGRDGGVTDPSTAGGPIPWTTAAPISVTGARLGDDHRTLALDAQVPHGPHPCVRGLRAVVTDTVPQHTWVQITYSSPSGDRRSGCTGVTTATARVRLPEPLGARDLIVDNSTVFTADGAHPPALRLCGPLGCRPPATGCTAASYEQALMAVDAPEHTYREAEVCDGKWLVLDFSWRTGPVCGDGEAPECSSRLGDRWFFRAEPAGWVPIVHGTHGGCQDVRREEPAFPVSMCVHLAPFRGAR